VIFITAVVGTVICLLGAAASAWDPYTELADPD
jgi:hypothetical protein